MNPVLSRLVALPLLWALLAAAPALSDEPDPFERGWRLDPALSELKFISLKQGNIAETNHFKRIAGEIDETGNATIRVSLNSVETFLDIRNVRLRFLMFETYRYPTAEITVRIDRGALNDLETVKRVIVPMTYTLSMHRRQITRTERLALFLIDEDTVAVSNADPIFVGVSDLDLLDGLRRLEEAAGVSISPLAIVSFDFTFRRTKARTGPGVSVAGQAPTAAGAAPVRIGEWNAIRPDAQTCVARILTLGRLDSVRFEPRTARILDSSLPLLDAYADAMARCPDLRLKIEGVTDAAENARDTLAQQRAASISRMLWARGVQRARMTTVAGGKVNNTTQPPGGGRAVISVID